MSEKSVNLWDEKAGKYPRFSEDLTSIQKGAFALCERVNLGFAGLRVVDIGCGTGIWTLHIARKCGEMVAVDSAAKMLEILKEDALKLGLKNVSCVNVDFKGFCELNKRDFDLAFVSMSPALKAERDFKAFCELAPRHLYVGWEKYRQSDFLTPIFTALGAKQKCFNEDDLECFLKREKIPYERESFSETRTCQKDFAQALESAKWHLNMAQTQATPKELESLIKSHFTTHTTITETIKSKIKVLVF